jgi:hypothetical protein
LLFGAMEHFGLLSLIFALNFGLVKHHLKEDLSH